MDYLKEILKTVGIDGERLMIEWCTAAEGQKFQQVALRFDKKIRDLGLSPINIGSDTPKKKKKKKAKA